MFALPLPWRFPRARHLSSVVTASLSRLSAAEPVVAAEKLLRQALTETRPLPENAVVLTPTPILVDAAPHASGSGGVRVVLETPPDVDAAKVLNDALIESLQWRLDSDGIVAQAANRSWKSGEFVTSLYSMVEGARLRLHIPHTLEPNSTSETPMLARPRLQAGSLTLEVPSLSIRLARALANAAQTASTERDEPDARTGGGPLRALDKLIEPLPKLPAAAACAAPSTCSGAAAATGAATGATAAPPPFFNEAALRASAANAATFPEMKLPARKPPNNPSGAGGGGGGSERNVSRAMDRTFKPSSELEAIELISELGARVVLPTGGAVRDDGWEALAGGDRVRRSVDEALLMPLRHPDAFRSVLSATRAGSVTPPVRPTAMLFHGPPGTGKTAAARIAAEMAALPLVAAPLESLISKWFGEGEQKLAALFSRCEQLGACVLFLDELDALAGSRDRDMHEASRRMLSVLLRHLDGFDAIDHVALIGATNRPEDLDPALVSRFDVRVHFAPPDASARALVFGRYAKHLSADELQLLAEQSNTLSGRDILDVCKQAERKWVYSQLVGEIEAAGGLRLPRKDALEEAPSDTPPLLPPPPIGLYMESVTERCAAMKVDPS